MNYHKLAIFAILIIISIAIIPVSADETHTDVYRINAPSVTSITNSGGGGTNNARDILIYTDSIQKLSGFAEMLVTANGASSTITGGSTPFTASIGATSVGSGTITVTNVGSSNYNIDILWTTFNPGAFTGAQTITLNYSNASLGGYHLWQQWESAPYGGIATTHALLIGGDGYDTTANAGAFKTTVVKNVNFENDITATKISSTGKTTVTIKRTGFASGVTSYSSLDITDTGTASSYGYSTNDSSVITFGAPISVSLTEFVTGQNKVFNYFEPSYNMTISPDTFNSGSTTTASITSSAGSYAMLNAYTLICNLNGMPQSAAIKSAGNQPTYVKKSGIWYQFDDATNLPSHALSDFPANIVLTGFTSPGKYTCEATLFQSDNYAPPRIDQDVNVSSSGSGPDSSKTISFNVKDTNGAYVSGATASIQKPDGTWINNTVTNGPINVIVPSNSIVGYTATAAGFNSLGELYRQITMDSSIDVIMTRTPLLNNAGNATVTGYVKTGSNGQWKALSNAQVMLSDGQTKVSGDGGIVTFEILPSSTYYVTVTADGYNSITVTYTSGAAGSTGGLALELTPKTADTPVPTLTDSNGNPITPVPTQDIRTDQQKEIDLASIVINNGPALIMFFIVLIFIGGFKMISK